MKKIILTVSIILLFLINGCDKGIEPADEITSPTGFKGKVTFTGNWNNNIKRTHLVVFKKPINKDEDFFPPNLTFVIDSIPKGSSQFNYNSLENNYIESFTISAGEYSYVVVAQSNSPELSLLRKDWVVVGVYCENGDQSKPKKLIINAGKITDDININVDFNNPPPQPPGGM
ncbi:MAG: hypothetical protein RBS48_03265 [Ignavibacteriaceae bacterium]|jgi:hypothetical protein|nr:hypothetical protein [Ignavibacteriaceae bacterium]